MSLSQTIKRARQKSGISQGELARRTGLHYSYISRLESGNRIPEAEVLRVLSGHLDLPLLSLMLTKLNDELTSQERREYKPIINAWHHQTFST